VRALSGFIGRKGSVGVLVRFLFKPGAQLRKSKENGQN
jgi:hypothetical protein